MRSFLRAAGVFLAGILAGAAAVFAVLYRRAEDRYRTTKEVEDEITEKSKAAAAAAREEVERADPHAVVDSLPPDARERIGAINADALADARERSRRRAAELAAGGLAPPDRAGPTGDR